MKNLLEEEGWEVVAEKEEERRRIWEEGEWIAEGEGKKRVFGEVDGTGINDRATKGWFEAKVEVIFSEAKEISKDKVEIWDKKTYATLENVSGFGKNFGIEAAKFRVFNSEEVIFVGDGAGWCLKLMEENFSGSTYVLDFRHLARNIKVCLGAERKELVGRLLYLAVRGETDEMTSPLWLLLSSSRDPTWRAQLLELIKYIEKNA